MTDFLAGARIKSQDFPAAVYAISTVSQGNETSTTYITGSPVVSVTFTAPTSGRVVVTVGAKIRDDAADNVGAVSFELYEGTDATGTLILAADDDRSVRSVNVGANLHGYSFGTLATGLTVGATHFARVMHRVNGGSGVDVNTRDISVIPTW